MLVRWVSVFWRVGLLMKNLLIMSVLVRSRGLLFFLGRRGGGFVFGGLFCIMKM